MIRKIVSAKDPVLRQKAKPVGKVDKKVEALVKDLKDTLIAQRDPEGVGLAAPQIGKGLRVFAMLRDSKDILIVINPKVISKTKPAKGKPKTLEGCLSIPHYYGPLKRANQVELEYMNEAGKRVTERFKDLEAQIVLHEVDHLNGVLFIDHLFKAGSRLYKQDSSGEWEEVEI